MRVLCYGSINIDTVFSVQDIVRPGETIPSDFQSTNPGGKGANQAAALGKAGAAVSMAGKIGTDGAWILERLATVGVDVRGVVSSSEKTGCAIIQVSEKGENSIVLYGGTNHAIARYEIDSTLARFSAGDILLLQNEINEIPYIMELAARKKMRICFNPAPFDREILAAYPLGLVDLFIVNRIEGMGLFGREADPEETLEGLVRNYPHAEILMTLGENGSMYRHGNECLNVGTYESKTVDTTAAGDTYIGYFLAGRISGLAVEDAMKRASKAAALTVTRLGAMDSIPFASEVDASSLPYRPVGPRSGDAA